MRVFITGAAGFVGSHLVGELISGGHSVVGLTRSEAGAAALRAAGAEALHGDVGDRDLIQTAACDVDAVVHTAFNHDFSKLREASEADRRVIEALGSVLSGTGRPLVITSGTGLAKSLPGRPSVETDQAMASSDFARGATEEAAGSALAAGASVMVMRLPQVHDTSHQGRVAQQIALARRKGEVAFAGDGDQRVPAAHVSDVVKLYRAVLENGAPGARYHAVAEEGVEMRRIAHTVGERLSLPVVSIAEDDVQGYFGWLAPLMLMDLASSGHWTRSKLDWHPAGPTLLADLAQMEVE